ncbi:MAG: hypothetical protein EZS28_035173 [Streblomastix strix]|uniref:Uncharacterized protein n=1 Tax=Streblomastix strix TaxID=222440 RepID=A0A5J4UH17_9EUKA|nr:MAG: hypothetical protein EZS28_035173 [Streblomastix strix]
MARSEAYMMDLIQIHDETLFENSKYNKQLDDLPLLKANVAYIVDRYSKSEDDALLLLKADKSELIDLYSNSEDDALLLQKTDKSDTQSNTEDDALLLLKADKTELIDAYSKSEDDVILLLKANVADIVDSYSKTEDDELLLLKANVADLTNYVDLTSAQTITEQKQFGQICGGDMLVSSLFTQPELQEVRDITSTISKTFVFSTQGELNDWMAVQDNVAKLVIADNLCIVDKEVTDYWWDETDLKVLETEFPDMSNVTSTLGAATGGGGVRSIVDIQSASYTKSEDDALLLLKADKTQLIDSYYKSETYARDVVFTKTETNNLLNNKADTGVSYTKGEVDALLLLKADKTQLIDSYNKSETYAKDEVYTKGETNNLLDNKANLSTAYCKSETYAIDEVYSKPETNQLISQIDVSDVDLTDYYNKSKTDELLDGMSTTTGSSFVNSGADNTVALLGAGGTKPISEFTTTIDDSNYVKKRW